MAETRGTRYLQRQGIAFEVLTYAHAEKGAAFAAAALGIPLERFAKTLVAEAGGDPVFALVPGDCELSLKKLAQASGARQATMADPGDAERLTGYVTGGISPFGARRALPTFVEASLLAHRRMALNAGQRGVILELAAGAVVDLLDASVCELTS